MNEINSTAATANPSVKSPNRLYFPDPVKPVLAKPNDVDGFRNMKNDPGASQAPREIFNKPVGPEQLPDTLVMSSYNSITTSQGVLVGGGVYHFRVPFTGTCFIFQRPTGVANDMNMFINDDPTKQFRLCLGTDAGDKQIWYAGLPYKSLTVVYNGGNFNLICFSRDVQFSKI